MWTVVSARWSVGLRSQRLRLDTLSWAEAFQARLQLLQKPPELRQALPGLITRFARQIARFSARLTPG